MADFYLVQALFEVAHDHQVICIGVPGADVVGIQFEGPQQVRLRRIPVPVKVKLYETERCVSPGRIAVQAKCL